MTIINQTNRTLLLEEINPEKLDLLTLIGDVKGIDSLSDERSRRSTSIWSAGVMRSSRRSSLPASTPFSMPTLSRCATP